LKREEQDERGLYPNNQLLGQAVQTGRGGYHHITGVGPCAAASCGDPSKGDTGGKGVPKKKIERGKNLKTRVKKGGTVGKNSVWPGCSTCPGDQVECQKEKKCRPFQCGRRETRNRTFELLPRKERRASAQTALEGSETEEEGGAEEDLAGFSRPKSLKNEKTLGRGGTKSQSSK